MATGVSATDDDLWRRAVPDEPEGHAYHAACEAAGERPFDLAAAVVREGGRTVAVCPTFAITYRLDTSLQGPVRRLTDGVRRICPRAGDVRLLALGSPYADRCVVALDPTLPPARARAVVGVLVDGVLLDGVLAEARRRGIKLVGVKDLLDEAPDPARTHLAAVLAARRFARIEGLPNCLLDLPHADTEAYLGRLSRPTRKDIRRKLKAAGPVQVERRVGLAGVAEDVRALHRATQAASGVDYDVFETLPDRYFETVTDRLGASAVTMLYRVGGELAAFNLLLSRGRVVDKFLGLRRDLAEAHNLYAVSWMENVRFCLEHGIPLLQLGPTAYTLKMRFGCRLARSGVWFHHRGRVTNAVLRAVAPFAAFDRFDAELAAWRRRHGAF
jgi:hypothetical protein